MKNNESVSDYYEDTPQTRFKQTYACAHETRRYIKKKPHIFLSDIFVSIGNFHLNSQLYNVFILK